MVELSPAREPGVPVLPEALRTTREDVLAISRSPEEGFRRDLPSLAPRHRWANSRGTPGRCGRALPTTLAPYRAQTEPIIMAAFRKSRESRRLRVWVHAGISRSPIPSAMRSRY